MDFQYPYLLAMREQAPKMFMELRRSGKMNQFLQDKGEEANRLLAELLANKPKDKYGLYSLVDEREAEEIVGAQLIEFPVPEKDQNPEPPDDLPSKSDENFRQPPAQQPRQATARETADVADCSTASLQSNAPTTFRQQVTQLEPITL